MPPVLHGPALVDHVASRLGLDRRVGAREGRGLTTPSIERWHAYVAPRFARRPTSWPRLVARLAPWLRGMDAGLAGPLLVLVVGDEQATFLWPRARDARGEWPVLMLDARDREVSLVAPGFDVWLALHHDLWTSVPPGYRARMREHARALGRRSTIPLEETKTMTAKSAKAGSDAKSAAKGGGAVRGLTTETAEAIRALALRRKGDVLVAALELAKKREGRLDDAMAKAVAKLLGRRPDEGVVLADLVRIAPGAIRKDKRLRR